MPQQPGTDGNRQGRPLLRRAIEATGGDQAPVALVWRLPLGLAKRLIGLSRTEVLLLEKDLTQSKALSFEYQLTIRPVSANDRPLIEVLHRENGVDRGQRERIARYFDRGYNGFLAFQGDQPIGYLWWVDDRPNPAGSQPELRTYAIRLTQGEVYAFDFYIAPPFRGGSRALEFFARAQDHLRDQGYSRVFGLVDVEKRPARWIYSALGWKTIRTMVGHTVFSSIGILDGRVFLARRGY